MKLHLGVRHNIVAPTLFFLRDNKKLIILNYDVLLHVSDCLVCDSLQSKLLLRFGQLDLLVY